MAFTQTSKSPDTMANVASFTANGTADAITSKTCTVLVTSTSANALTLANPVAGDDDGKVVTVRITTPYAHTITTGAGGINGTLHIATFSGVPGQSLRLEAYNGSWWTYASPPALGVTLT